MRSAMVVKFKIFRQPFPQVVAFFTRIQIYIFLFYTPPQSFNEDVVQSTSTTIHANFYIIDYQ